MIVLDSISPFPEVLLAAALIGVGALAHSFFRPHRGPDFDIGDIEDVYAQGFEDGHAEQGRLDLIDVQERAVRFAKRVLEEGL